MGEPGRTRAPAEWWKSLSGAWRTNVALYGLATIALVALVAQIAVGGGQPPQRVEVASRAPARTAPTSPRLPTTTTTTTTVAGTPVTAAPDTTAAPGPTPSSAPPAPAPLSVGPSTPVPQDTTTVPPICPKNSTDVACGPFFWDPPSNGNQPLTVSASASPTNPRVGDVVTFTVQVVDPDHPVTDNCAEIDFGDGQRAQLPCSHPQCPDAHGAWEPPPAIPGNQTFTYTHQYAAERPYTASFTFHTDQDPPCPNPYGSANSGYAPLTVSGP